MYNADYSVHANKGEFGNMLSQQWSYFVSIVENRSITKAAEQLYLSQPSLSKYLARLEKELQTLLFDRSFTPLKLTPAGELYYRYVKEQMKIEQQFMSELDLLKNTRSAILRIGIGIWRGTYMLPEILPLFFGKYPSVDIQIMQGTSAVILDALGRGETDLCITSVADKYPNLAYQKLGSEMILLVGGNSHPFIKNANISRISRCDLPCLELNQLPDETFLLTTKTQNFSKIIEDYFTLCNFKPSSIMRIENLTTGVHLAAQGRYFTFLPEAGLKFQTLPSNVTCFTIGQPPLTFEIAIAYKKNTALSWAGKAFITTIAEHYRQPRTTCFSKEPVSS